MGSSVLGISQTRLVQALVTIAVVILSASVHEYGHALAAHLCGDDTAAERGRLTINPAAHLDPFGSVLLPLLLALSGGVTLAYARPVPYDPRRLRNPRRDEAIVAAAGPLANLAQATVGAIAFRVAGAFLAQQGAWGVWAARVLLLYVSVNVSLMLFNLIPVPPLDGSKLVMPLLRGDALARYRAVQRYAMPIMLAVLYLLPEACGIDPVGWYVGGVGGRVLSLLLGA